MEQNIVKVAIQKDGRLKSASLKLLDLLGLDFNKENGRTLIVSCKNAPVEILYVRHSEIPKYVQSGIIDFGIVGENVLYENNFNVKQIRKLGFGQCTLIIGIPTNSDIQNVKDLQERRIATSYPNSLQKFLLEQKLNATVVELKGAVEASPALGLSDAICDLTQTGKTLKENNLKPIETLFNSEAVLIESPFIRKGKTNFLERFCYEKVLS